MAEAEGFDPERLLREGGFELLYSSRTIAGDELHGRQRLYRRMRPEDSGRRLTLSLDAAADGAVEALGDEVGRLWAPYLPLLVNHSSRIIDSGSACRGDAGTGGPSTSIGTAYGRGSSLAKSASLRRISCFLSRSSAVVPCEPSLSAVEIVTALYFGGVLRHDPDNPEWPERDRFVLSKGHAAPIQYAALARFGYFPLEDLMGLRKIGAQLQATPVAGHHHVLQRALHPGLPLTVVQALAPVHQGVVRPLLQGTGGYPHWHSEVYPKDANCDPLHRVLAFGFLAFFLFDALTTVVGKEFR